VRPRPVVFAVGQVCQTLVHSGGAMSELLVSMEGIDRSFPGVRALDGCRFELRAGEVHALVGENGAGKSTMMKVLAGVHVKDAGRIQVKGREVDIPNPRAAQNLGISIIHQELDLVSHLTVAQNIFIGHEPRRRVRFLLDENAINEKAQAVLDRLSVSIDPRTRVSDLTVAKQQMVEIARALSLSSDVLIMDEPTAALTDAEIGDLFRIIRQLSSKGVGVVHISHRLEELPQISDRITVMRDGHTVDTLVTKEASIDQIIRLMVGRTIYEGAPEIPDLPDHEVVLEVRHLNRGRVLRDINFSLRRGEILGVAGLVGAGRTEVARAIFGADPIDSGEILVRGKPVRIRSPRDAVRHGIAYLSEDRKRFGLALGMDVETNIVLATFQRFLRRLGWVNEARTRAVARKYVDALSIRTPSLEQKAKNLSGGNQQKLVIGKWLTADTEILIFDEPTRGIDVGAKSEIYRLLNDLARQGKSIIMISSELPEVLRMSHRILVMCEGRVTGELPGAASQEEVMKYATRRNGSAREERAVQESAPAP
jgi:ribose transport system ATP-binding protein